MLRVFQGEPTAVSRVIVQNGAPSFHCLELDVFLLDIAFAEISGTEPET
jgi:hypothetical protein